MKFPWQKSDEEYYYENEKPKKQKETLAQTADKLIQRQMKKDPGGYGITAAEKIKGIHHGAPKTRSEFLKEMIEEDELKKEAGIGGGGGNKGIVQQFLEALPYLAEAMAQARAMMGGAQSQGLKPTVHIEQAAPVEQIDQGRAQVQAQPSPPPKLDMNMETLIPLAALTPEVAWETLQSTNEQGWILFFSKTSAEQIEILLADYVKNCEIPEVAEAIDIFLKTQHHWLQEIVELAHNSTKNERK